FLFGALSSIIDIVNALPDTVPNVPGSNTSPTAGVAEMTGPLTPHAIIVGIILIITGFIFCFFGRKIYHLTLFLIGFYVGAIAMWMALINNEPPGGYGGSNSNMTIILVVSLAAGLIVGMLFICCADFAVWLLGALAGYLFGVFTI
ncbi:10339_t:CDS:2, partial [Scutellospora calospora]